MLLDSLYNCCVCYAKAVHVPCNFDILMSSSNEGISPLLILLYLLFSWDIEAFLIVSVKKFEDLKLG